MILWNKAGLSHSQISDSQICEEDYSDCLSEITRLIALFICGLLSDLVTCKHGI